MSADISVIITAYNVEAYIGRAIQSALDQQGVTVEVVVVDDGSADNSWAIISRIRDPRIRAIRNLVNCGPGAARNTAIAAATAPWIAILDGDDAFLPGRLARLMERAKAMKADIVVDNLLVHREAAGGADFPMFAPRRFSRRKTLDLSRFIAGNRSFMGGYTLGYLKPLFSAEFLRRHTIAYDTDIRIGEDYLLLAQALACGAACAVEATAGYLYTARAGSTSHRLSPADVRCISDGDKKLLARYTLDAASAKAQKRREFSLKEAYAFTKLTDAIKQRNSLRMLSAIAISPTSVRFLWLPVWARIMRLIRSPQMMR